MTQYKDGKPVKNSEDLVIEHHVPFPDDSKGPYGKYIKAAREMEVGDSFVTKATRDSIIINMSRATGRVFMQRIVEDGKIRIWRTK